MINMLTETHQTIKATDQIEALPQWIMFEIAFNNESLNTLADALSLLLFLDNTTSRLYKDIFMHRDKATIQKKAATFLSSLDVPDFILLMLEELAGKILSPTTAAEMLWEQKYDQFYHNTTAQRYGRNHIDFLLSNGGIFSRLTTGDEQTVLLQALQTSELHISHYTETDGHLGDGHLFHVLRRFIYWFCMWGDYYVAARAYNTWPRMCVQLRHYIRLEKLFSSIKLLEFDTNELLEE